MMTGFGTTHTPRHAVYAPEDDGVASLRDKLNDEINEFVDQIVAPPRVFGITVVRKTGLARILAVGPAKEIRVRTKGWLLRFCDENDQRHNPEDLAFAITVHGLVARWYEDPEIGTVGLKLVSVSKMDKDELSNVAWHIARMRKHFISR